MISAYPEAINKDTWLCVSGQERHATYEEKKKKTKNIRSTYLANY